MITGEDIKQYLVISVHLLYKIKLLSYDTSPNAYQILYLAVSRYNSEL